MTIVTSEVRLTSGSLTLPRVNLLPPEIAEKRAFRRLQLGLGCAVLAAIGVVGLVYTSAAHSVSSAQSELDTQTAQSVSLQAQTAKYSNVTAVYARANAAQMMLQTAMSDEVRFSQLLNDLSLSVPSNVWIKSLAYTTTPPAATAATGAAAPTSAAAANATSAAGTVRPIGTVTATTIAFSHDDVALWLESLAGLKTYANPYFSSAAEGLMQTRKIVTFTSTATVTSAAHSGRYTKPVGG
ncbi:MAG: Fimbrial assembly family protein [Frankiales bacterium]|nr:Fimbrial assembly family protein [Frankiales bacterium]